MSHDNLLFALDIGTRTVVGLVTKPTPEGLEIIASEVIEHENRAMLDGQIHNVIAVARVVQTIKSKLEDKIGQQLTRVAVAAAGRALKTTRQTYHIEFPIKREIIEEDVNTLEIAAIQEAQKGLIQENKNSTDYHFVGYSVIAYRLDDMHIGNLVGQKGKKMELDLIATFLPRIVVDSLVSVIQHADLTVQHMTLEPIAASNVVIPREMHNFNLALVDIGAGTSDIAITKGGSIIAYAMVPVAGDEITEALAEYYLLDYTTGEFLKRSLTSQEKVAVKDILGNSLEVDTQEAILVLKEPVDNLAGLIAEEILSLNEKAPQAVLCIGGGSLTPLLTRKLAEKLNLPPNRVGIKQATDIKGIIGEITDLSSTQTVTPIGIALTSWQNANQTTFLDIKLNGQRATIFSLSKPTVADALLATDTPVYKLHGRPGLALTFKVNGQLKTIKGTMGEPGRLEVNGNPAQLDTPIKDGDEITYIPGKDGEPGKGKIKDIIKFAEPKTIILNGSINKVETRVFMNGKLVKPDTPIEDRVEITTITPETYRQALAQLLEIPEDELITREISIYLNNQKLILNTGKYDIKINGEYIDLDTPIEDNVQIDVSPLINSGFRIKDLIDRFSSRFSLNIIFNNRELTVPTKSLEIIKNGQQAFLDTIIEDGDNIIINPRPISFNQVLSFINYQVPQSLAGKLEMTINGRQAKFTDSVNNGDVLEIKIC